MTQISGIQKAVDKFDGSPSKLAIAVGSGVLRQHVEHWLKVGRVSAEKCPEVAASTGISCEELNDKVNWSLVRDAQTATSEELNHLMTKAAQAGLIERRSLIRRAEDRAMLEELKTGKVG